MSLLDKLMKNSTSKYTSVLEGATLYQNREICPTDIPALNLALSGDLKGGLTSGTTVIAGPSKHFKTMFSLAMGAAYLRKYPEAVMLFYDTEFGSPEAYFDVFGIDKKRVVITPVTDIAEMTHDITRQLSACERGDKVFILIDSIGNVASNKEVQDALDNKQVADMTRAKQIKSLFRIVTPQLNLKDIPLVAINHTYQTLELYSKSVVSGGTGIYYSADTILIVGRQQEKQSASNPEVIGYNFILNVEKSRFLKEKSKIPISVTWENGINKWSGLFEMGLALGAVQEAKKGSYYRVDPETGEVDDTTAHKKRALQNDSEFWRAMLRNEKFVQAVSDAYRLGGTGQILDVEEHSEG